MIEGMKKFEKIVFDENKEALIGTFSLSDDTDIPVMFEAIWTRFKNEPEENVANMFVGIDVSREAFLTCFKSDDDFKQQSRHKQKAFLMAVNAALTKAVRERHLLIANGISVFILWVVAMLQKDYETAKHIEKSFADLRNEYDL